MTADILDRIDVRQAVWAAIFMAILAALLFPTIIISAATGHQITIFEQVGLILAATVAVQLLRKQPVAAVTGTFERGRLTEFALGSLAGAALMTVPAFLLWAAGAVHFAFAGTSAPTLIAAIGTMLGVAVAEELLFRGVLFQRLVDAVGMWPAQLAIAALFALTHLGNPGMVGATKAWATANIFLASIMFGMAYLRTRSLGMPIGLHFMANVTQGVILGFGVSGTKASRMLVPVFGSAPEWITGGDFGLEASPLGLVAVICAIFLLRHKQGRGA